MPAITTTSPGWACSIAARIARRPAQGAYTYGFTRVDTLSGQLNGMTLLLLATWFAVLGVRRLVNPVQSVHGGVVGVVAIVVAGASLFGKFSSAREAAAPIGAQL